LEETRPHEEVEAAAAAAADGAAAAEAEHDADKDAVAKHAPASLASPGPEHNRLEADAGEPQVADAMADRGWPQDRGPAAAPPPPSAPPAAPKQGGSQLPLMRALREHPRAILVATASTACYSFSVWFLTAFPPTLYGALMEPALAPPPRMWLMHALSCCFLSFFYPAWGWAGDAVGYEKMMMGGGMVLAAAAPPCTWLMGSGSIAAAAFGQTCP